MGFQVQTVNLINGSWGLLQLRDLIFDTVSALVSELGEQQGMVGDDDAGAAFTSAYKPSAATLIDQAGFASVVMSQGAQGLLETAENYLATESRTAAELLGSSYGDSGVAAQPSRSDCGPLPSHHGEDLPEVVGATTGVDQYLLNERFRGDPGKLRSVAATWRKAAGLFEAAYHDAVDCWRTARLDHAGETADGIERFFQRFVGKVPPGNQPHGDEALLPNLSSACRALAAACDAYSDHIETALTRIPTESNPITGDPLFPWEEPVLGGNGHDGGLAGLVSGDTYICRLAGVPPALDSSQAKVKLPHLDTGPSLPGLPPWLAPVVRVPIAVPAVYRPAQPGVRVQPVPAPTPHDPRFPPLTGPQREKYRTWLASLRTGDISGGRPAEVAYQKRVAGYPEYEVPLPAGISKSSTLMVDGFRDSDGMAIEAKYVNDPGKCYRTLDDLRENHQTGKRDFLFAPDRKELDKYAAAMNDPRNKGAFRGVETVTNNRDSIPYWRAMMAAHGVKGYARYVP